MHEKYPNLKIAFLLKLKSAVKVISGMCNSSSSYDDDDDDKKAFAGSSALDFIVICDVNASFFTQAMP